MFIFHSSFGSTSRNTYNPYLDEIFIITEVRRTFCRCKEAKRYYLIKSS